MKLVGTIYNVIEIPPIFTANDVMMKAVAFIDEDENFIQFALLVNFPRKKTYLEQANHFKKWHEEQFFARFWLLKGTVKFILDQIRSRIS